MKEILTERFFKCVQKCLTMVYILGKNLRDDKKLSHALCTLPGIGKSASSYLMAKLRWSPNIKVGQLTSSQLSKLLFEINSNYYVGTELQKLIQKDISRLTSISCYRGFRQVQKLQVKGQRTN